MGNLEPRVLRELPERREPRDLRGTRGLREGREQPGRRDLRVLLALLVRLGLKDRRG